MIDKKKIVKNDLAVINRILSYWHEYGIAESFDFDTWIAFCDLSRDIDRIQTELKREGVIE